MPTDFTTFTHDAAKCVLVIDDIQITQLAGGTPISFKKPEPEFSSEEGALGTTVVSEHHSKKGELQLVLMGGPQNALLDQRRKDRKFVRISYSRSDGTDLINSPHARIREIPAIETGRTHAPRTWMFELFECTYDVGGLEAVAT